MKHLHEADADRDSGIDDYASHQDDHFVDCLIEVKKLPPRRRFLDVITDAADDILTSSDHRCFRLFRSEKTWLILSSFVLWISALTLPSPADIDLGQPGDGRQHAQVNVRAEVTPWPGSVWRAAGHISHTSRVPFARARYCCERGDVW